MPAASHKNLVQPIFEVISGRASQNLGADYFVLVIIDPARPACEVFVNSRGKGSGKIEEMVRAESPLAWHDSRSHNLSFICENSDTQQQSRLCQIFFTMLNCRQVLAVPFEIEDIGGGFIIWAWQKTPPDFAKNYIERAALIKEQISLSLKLSLKEQRSNELNAKLAALLELSTSIYSSLNYTEVLEKAISLSMKIIGADGGSIFILDKKANLLKPLITVDEKHEDKISKVTLRPGEGITGLVVQTGIGLISNHSESDERAFQVPGTPQEPESLICAPMTWSGEVIGAATLRSTSGRQFVDEDLEILTIFARQTADAIENAKLFESLESAYNELSKTQEQLILTEKLRALGEMAGGVAHDFNNVLGTILGRTQLLLTQVDDPRWIEHLKQIEKVTFTGAKTVRKLQHFTRVSSRGQFEHIDLNKVVGDAVETTKPRWKDECQRQEILIDLRCDYGEISPILGNSGELVEAVSNLILNSIDALPRGGVIEIRTFMADQQAVVTVEDNGVGISAEAIDRIFYPFFTTKGKQGTGMGLAVVYGIVTRHKGEIDVVSKPGQGTTCKLSFPATREIKSDKPAVAPVVKEINARILVIDDDENIRNIIFDMLEYLGHTIELAAAGEEGVEKFKTREFDLVITDLGMPGISGWEVTRICKSLNPAIPVIMVSGWGNQINDEMVFTSGLDGIMAKPFEMDKINTMIQETLAKSRATSGRTDAETGKRR